MNKWLQRNDGLIVFATACLWILYVFNPYVFQLNQFLFSSSGDGLKNYYTYLYQVWYGQSATHFEGMNYPFGEHVVFTDGMPGLVWLIQILSSVFPGIDNYALLILHGLMLLSIPIGALFLYRIIRQWNLPRMLAGWAAIIIVSSCIQYIRIERHFGMAFLCYIPMIWYFVTQYHRTEKNKYSIYLCISTTAFAFLHLYNLAFSLVLVLAYVFVYVVFYRRNGWRNNLKHLYKLLLSIIVSSVVFQVFMKLTDSIQDRTDYPYGVFGGATEMKHFFLNAYSMFGFTFQFIFGSAKRAFGEGSVYLGLVSIAALPVLLGLVINYFIKRKKEKTTLLQTLIPEQWGFWLLIAFLILLLGMGIPVTLDWKSIIDYMSVMRQFRTVGRFSWIFYYMFQILILVFLFRTYIYLLNKNMRVAARTMAVVCIVIASLEGYAIRNYYIKDKEFRLGIYAHIMGVDPEYDIKSKLQKHNYKPEDFQAVLGLPFYHVGSEKLWVEMDENAIIENSMAVGLQTGLPIIDVMMSRTSWSQTFESVRLVNGPFAQKNFLKRFNEKPLLIIVDTVALFDPNEKFMLNAADYLFSFQQFKAYHLDLKQLKQLQQKVVDSFSHIASMRTEDEGIIFSDTTAFWHVQSFDEGNIEGIFGKAFFHDEKIRKLQVDSFHLPKMRASNYVFSIWAKVANNIHNIPTYIVEQYSGGGELLLRTDFGAKTSTYTQGDLWLLLEKPLKIHPVAEYVIVYLEDAFPRGYTYLGLDNLAIYPEGAVYFKKANGKLYLNQREQ